MSLLAPAPKAAALRYKMAAGRMAVLALAMQTMQAPGARAGAVGAAAAARTRVHCRGGASAFAFCRHDTVSLLWGALRGTGTRVMRRLGVTRSASRVFLRSPTPQLSAARAGGARAASSLASPGPASADGDDLWLEEVDSDAALGWVRKQNAQTFKTLGDPADSKLYPRLKSIYESKDKIPYAVKRGNKYYNFWQDAENPRGLWRRTSWEEYQKASPAWEVLLDVDKLGKDEGKSWYF